MRGGRSFFLFFLVATLGLIPSGALAQFMTDTVFGIDSVMVTARRRVQEVIPAQRLEGKALMRLNSHSVADAIRYFSGVQLKDYGGVGGLKTVNIRSMGTNHTGVFYDGFQLGNAQNGQVDLGKYSLDNLEAISLYNGQKSEIFQSARDFGAAGNIYLIPRSPTFEPGRSTNFRVSLKGGSFGLLNPSLRYEHQIIKNVSTSLSTEWVTSHGRYPFRYRRVNVLGEVAYDTLAVRQNGDINALRLELGAQGEMRRGDWRVATYHYSSERGMPGAIVNNVWRRGERLWDRNSFVQGTARYEPLSWAKVMCKTRYAYDFTRYVNNDEKLIQVENSYRQQEFYASFVALAELPIKGWDISAAYDLQWNKLLTRNEAMDSTMYDFPFPSRVTHLVSLATALHVWHIKVQGSLLGTLVRNHVERYQKPPSRNVLSPAIYLSYAPFGWDLSVRTFFKKSFRMPTFNDLYYTDMGNANLRPEYVTQYNVGLAYVRSRSERTLAEIRLSVDAYYNEVRDKIVAYPKGQQFRWTMLNLGYVEIRGIDASAQCTLSPWDRTAFTLHAQYTHQRAQDFTNPADNFYTHQIPYIPWHSGTAIVSLAWREWNLNYSFIYVGERYNQQENIRYNHTQPWYTHDLSLSWEPTLWGYEMRFMAEVNNLLAQDYDVILNYPMPKRNYRFTIAMKL